MLTIVLQSTSLAPLHAPSPKGGRGGGSRPLESLIVCLILNRLAEPDCPTASRAPLRLRSEVSAGIPNARQCTHSCTLDLIRILSCAPSTAISGISDLCTGAIMPLVEAACHTSGRAAEQTTALRRAGRAATERDTMGADTKDAVMLAILVGWMCRKRRGTEAEGANARICEFYAG